MSDGEYAFPPLLLLAPCFRLAGEGPSDGLDFDLGLLLLLLATAATETFWALPLAEGAGAPSPPTR